MPEARTLTEWIVLGLLAEGPGHGWALARELRPSTELGQVWTVSRPLVYRAVDHLVVDGLAVERAPEAVPTGPPRTVITITPKGRRALRRWLSTPTEHVRDLRTELLAKLLLCGRAGADSRPLLTAQRARLDPIVEVLDERARARPDDPVAAWRAHSARAARSFVSDLLG